MKWFININNEDDLKKRYRELSKIYHPDVNRNADAMTKMQEINGEYEMLIKRFKTSKESNYSNFYQESYNAWNDSFYNTHDSFHNSRRSKRNSYYFDKFYSFFDNHPHETKEEIRLALEAIIKASKDIENNSEKITYMVYAITAVISRLQIPIQLKMYECLQDIFIGKITSGQPNEYKIAKKWYVLYLNMLETNI